VRSKLIIFLFIFILSGVKAQIDSSTAIIKTDTVVKYDKKKVYARPRKATVMSALLPGLGQAYNRKFWKIPVIYAGLGGFGYLFYINNSNFFNYKHALIYSQNADNPEPGYGTVDGRAFSTDQLLVYKNQYKKRRDICVIALCSFYLLNIIDANVDAHLRTFDVSDDLSMQIKPWEDICYSPVSGYKFAGGVTFKFTLK
jgi:hypothetical protein